MKQRIFFLSACFTLLFSHSALAHHSMAMFDQNTEISLVGTIKEYQWTNPHTWIQIYVPDENGKLVEWSIESSSPNILKRRGWKSSSLLPGDVVTLTVNPLFDGSPGGALLKATMEDGRVLGEN